MASFCDLEGSHGDQALWVESHMQVHHRLQQKVAMYILLFHLSIASGPTLMSYIYRTWLPEFYYLNLEIITLGDYSWSSQNQHAGTYL